MPEDSTEPDRVESGQPFKVEHEHIITALREELVASQDNRLFLLATLKQIQAEYRDALALWQAEKQSLLARIEATEVTRTMPSVAPLKTVPSKVVPAKVTANGRAKGRHK